MFDKLFGKKRADSAKGVTSTQRMRATSGSSMAEMAAEMLAAPTALAQLTRSVEDVTAIVDGYGGGHESIRKCLAEHGLTPEDITHIVPTHLHYDHGWNLDLFPHAQIVVQRDELFHAIDPTPTQRIFYFRQTIIELINRKRPAGLRLIDGDIEAIPAEDLGRTGIALTIAGGRVTHDGGRL